MARIKDLFRQEELVAAALEGLLIQRSRIDEQIAQLRALLARAKSAPKSSVLEKSSLQSPAAAPRTRRKLSAEARARIAAAQKERWRKYRRQKKLEGAKGA